jgi:hypothetical protein
LDFKVNTLLLVLEDVHLENYLHKKETFAHTGKGFSNLLE